MFRPTRMKRFYLAVPLDREDQVLKRIGELGAVQLLREVPRERAEKGETAEAYHRFMRVYKRLDNVLATVSDKTQPEELVSGNTVEPSLEQLETSTDQIENDLDEKLKALEKAENEVLNLKTLEERLRFLDDAGLRVDEIGDFKHIFVKAGFLNLAMMPRLDGYVSGTSVSYVERPGRPRENFVVITGLNEDKQFAEATLKMLNFEEFSLPHGLNAEPETLLKETGLAIETNNKEIQDIRRSLLVMKKKADLYEPHVENALRICEAKSAIARTGKKSLIYGWIPSEKVAQLKTQVETVVPKEDVYLKLDDPRSDDRVPVELKNRGVLGDFQVFTNLLGVPNYFETDPTAILMILYVVMFGMMFGDIGGGLAFVLIGLMLGRQKKGLLAFSPSATRKLGHIIVSCGISAVIFGFLFGEFFLVEVFHPLLLSPLHDINEIIIIALTFGVTQLIVALLLNITNMFRRKETLKAVFGGHAIVALVFYVSGIYLAIAFIRTMNLGVFLQPDVIPFTIIALSALALVFLSPLIETMLQRKKTKRFEKLLEGFGEGLETFIASIANSVSYIRLAAFAIAHGALALAAVIFASVIGNVPSLILMNVIVFLVEGFAAFIQSLRLMYYEFSTKFFTGDGTLYRPFKTIEAKA